MAITFFDEVDISFFDEVDFLGNHFLYDFRTFYPFEFFGHIQWLHIDSGIIPFTNYLHYIQITSRTYRKNFNKMRTLFT